MFALLLAAATLTAPGAPSALAPRAARLPAVRLEGRVTDSAGTPVAEARVTVLQINRSAVTGPDGQYHIEQLPTGTYGVSVRAVGYAPQVSRVRLTGPVTTLDVKLRRSVVELPDVQVTASPLATSALESPQPTSVVGGEELDRSQASSLGETLNEVPGVHSFSTGVGIGKPVIRGLTSNRVLILDNGQRTESQVWGDEHSPNIETANADRIEVIRGPASVLYGSDALGGVVNVVQPQLPDAIGRAPFVHGRIVSGYASNNRQPDGSVVLDAASGGFGARIEGSGRTSEDVRTPAYTLWNSGNRAVGGGGTLSYRGSWGSLAGNFSQRNERISLTDGDPTATPTQRIATSRAGLDLALPFRASRLEIKTGWEQNRRREFENRETSDVTLGLLAKTWTGSAQYHHPTIGRLYGVIGASGLRTQFDKFGEETLIPNNRVWTSGVYTFEQLDIDRWRLSFGGRYDYRHLDVDADPELGVVAQTRTYNSVAGNVGVLYKVTDQVALVLNAGRGFRAPNSFELFSNGVHEGTVAFERGDPGLKNETSFNTDLALRAQTGALSLEIGGFANLIQNYIFSVPTGQTDSASGFDIFQFSQGNARLLGFEASAQWHPLTQLHVQLGADYTYGQNRTTDQPLPTIPPFRATYSVRYEGGSHGVVESPYLSVGGETNARQNRLNPEEAAFFAQAFDGAGYTSQAYSLVNGSAGFTLVAGRNPLHLDFFVRNLLNKSYADFLSRIKTNAPLPGMGRTFIARVTAEF